MATYGNPILSPDLNNHRAKQNHSADIDFGAKTPKKLSKSRCSGCWGQRNQGERLGLTSSLGEVCCHFAAIETVILWYIMCFYSECSSCKPFALSPASKLRAVFHLFRVFSHTNTQHLTCSLVRHLLLQTHCECDAMVWLVHASEPRQEDCWRHTDVLHVPHPVPQIPQPNFKMKPTSSQFLIWRDSPTVPYFVSEPGSFQCGQEMSGVYSSCCLGP